MELPKRLVNIQLCHGEGGGVQELQQFLLQLLFTQAARQCWMRCAVPHGRSGCLDSAEILCRSPCSDRRTGSPPCSVGHFSEQDCGFCSPCPPGKNTYTPAGTLVHGRRYTLSCRETKESRICCQPVKRGLPGR